MSSNDAAIKPVHIGGFLRTLTNNTIAILGFNGQNSLNKDSLNKDSLNKNELNENIVTSSTIMMVSPLSTTKREEVNLEVDKEAMDEHKNLDSLSYFIAVDEMKTLINPGIFWYFTYIKFICFINFLLTIISLINFIPYVVIDRVKRAFPDFFYLAFYTGRLHDYWFLSSCLSILLVFFTGALYQNYVAYISESYKIEHPDTTDPFMEEQTEDDKIAYDEVITSLEVSVRRVISTAILFLLLIIQGIINYNLQLLVGGAKEGQATISIFISVSVVLVNFVFNSIGKYLTRFEKHPTWTEYRRWDTIKNFLFKIFQIIVLYIAKNQAASTTTGCRLESMGSQFFWLLLLDLGMSTVGTILFDTVRMKLLKWWDPLTDTSSNEVKPEFDLSEEYVELIYRQFIVGLGIFVLPFIPAMALIGNFFEFHCDKYRMLYLCRKPRKTRNSFAGLIMVLYCVTGLAVIFMYPNGGAWILSGYNLKDYCAIFP